MILNKDEASMFGTCNSCVYNEYRRHSIHLRAVYSDYPIMNTFIASHSYVLVGGGRNTMSTAVSTMVNGTFASRKSGARDEEEKVDLLALRIFATDRQTGRAFD